MKEGEDINQPEQRQGNTAVMIAAKHNKKALVMFLIENGADLEYRNKLGLNALDYSIIHGNYDIAYETMNKMGKKDLKPLDDYIRLNFEMKVPRFNIPLFYQCLVDSIEPTKTPPLNLTYQSSKNFEGKIPDPNETWGDFFKRLARFELYKPPMVDKDSVPLEKRNSKFVRMQTKLLEMEYNTKIRLDEDGKNVDIEGGVEMKERQENNTGLSRYNTINVMKSNNNNINNFEESKEVHQEIKHDIATPHNEIEILGEDDSSGREEGKNKNNEI